MTRAAPNTIASAAEPTPAISNASNLLIRRDGAERGQA
jgi:hypothetical protein